MKRGCSKFTKLEGFEAPAVEWEKAILPSRVADFDPRWFDRLCLSGAVAWGRVSPHPAFNAANGDGPRRVIPSNAAPITFYLRDSAAWLNFALKDQGERLFRHVGRFTRTSRITILA